ncbi:MAG: hypothetical protein O7B99_06160 [Planctomycetota bacterium]|nr:hypothetical protein [Planctomycetota bacterium]
MPEATKTAAQTHCPVCGAKKTRPDSTICAYCAAPFDLVGVKKIESDEKNPNLARLAKMADHEQYAEAMEWQPIEGLEVQEAEADIKRGVVLIVMSALSLTAGLLQGWMLLAITAGLFTLLGAYLVLSGLQTRRKELAKPLLRRPALVLDRRSETSLGWWTGKTIYFFTLLLQDGAEGEFRWPGRGTEHDPLVQGATGVAYTRGDQLLGFRQVRV